MVIRAKAIAGSAYGKAGRVVGVVLFAHTKTTCVTLIKRAVMLARTRKRFMTPRRNSSRCSGRDQYSRFPMLMDLGWRPDTTPSAGRPPKIATPSMRFVIR